MGNDPVNMVDPDGMAGKVAWLIRLTASTTRYVSRITQEQAIKIRQTGGNIQADTRQAARQIETKAHGEQNLMKHKGHELKDGSYGRSHFQTDGVKGHSFWSITAAALASLADTLDNASALVEFAEDSVQNPANVVGNIYNYSKKTNKDKDKDDEGEIPLTTKDQKADAVCLHIQPGACR